MNAIIRTTVAVLALTGSAAYVNLSTGSIKPIAVKTNSMPVPTCAPGGQNGCGIGR